MTPSRSQVRCAAPVEDLWEALLDLPATADPVPLTRAVGDPGEVTLGWSFTARTGVGPLGVDDVMHVTSLQPPAGHEPGRMRIVKTGRLLDGWAEITAAADGAGASILTWVEAVAPRPLPLRVLAPDRLVALSTDALLERLVRDVVARAETAAPTSAASAAPTGQGEG